MNNPLEKLYCYLRVSSDVQMNDGGSLEVQRTIGKRVSKKLGLQYVELYEGSSSTMVRTEEELFNSPRPVYTKLKDLIRDGTVKHLWVFTNSRLHRETTEEGLFFSFYVVPNKVRFYVGERPEEQRFDTPDDFLKWISNPSFQDIKKNKLVTYHVRENERDLKEIVINHRFWVVLLILDMRLLISVLVHTKLNLSILKKYFKCIFKVVL